MQESERLPRVAAMLAYERCHMFLGLGKCNFRNEERHIFGILFDYLTDALS